MADAIDQSSAVCYGVSREYKESANCKLEGKVCKLTRLCFLAQTLSNTCLVAMYAHQAGVNLVPMMLVDNYKANGWYAPNPPCPHSLHCLGSGRYNSV